MMELVRGIYHTNIPAKIQNYMKKYLRIIAHRHVVIRTDGPWDRQTDGWLDGQTDRWTDAGNDNTPPVLMPRVENISSYQCNFTDLPFNLRETEDETALVSGM